MLRILIKPNFFKKLDYYLDLYDQDDIKELVLLF